MSDMRRREFITLLGGAAATWPLAARAQPGRVRRVVVLLGAAETSSSRGWLAAFLRRLDELGWRESGNLVTHVQWWNDQPEQMRVWAAELIARSPDVAVTYTNLALAVLKPIAGSVPIVFVGVGDPVGGGFVSSLARPGGNITGFASHEPSMGGKWLEVLKEAARAQQRTKMPTIGVLSVATPSAWSTPLSAFVEQLRELGWIDGRTVAIEYRWADGRSERFAELAAELVQSKVDVIVTAGGAVLAAKQATAVIPIVFAVASDPLATGLIASLAHPGSNVTGLSVQAADVAGKRVELLRELFPGVRTLAIIANLGYAAAAREMSEVQAAARSVGFETTTLEIRRAEDITGSIDTLKPGVDILYVCIDPITDTNQILIATSTLAARIPTMPGFRDAVKAGSLIFYGPNIPDLFRRAASFVDKILRGTKPRDIPVEQPTKFELVINLKTARALGLEIPDKLLALADEVIE
jgi:ABC-type uncharacterized transport system substrate-binding protein